MVWSDLVFYHLSWDVYNVVRLCVFLVEQI